MSLVGPRPCAAGRGGEIRRARPPAPGGQAGPDRTVAGQRAIGSVLGRIGPARPEVRRELVVRPWTCRSCGRPSSALVRRFRCVLTGVLVGSGHQRHRPRRELDSSLDVRVREPYNRALAESCHEVVTVPLAVVRPAVNRRGSATMPDEDPCKPQTSRDCACVLLMGTGSRGSAWLISSPGLSGPSPRNSSWRRATPPMLRRPRGCGARAHRPDRVPRSRGFLAGGDSTK